MKKTFVAFLLIFGLLLTAHNASAQRTTPSPVPSEDEEQIERIKDIVASRVAELNLVEKKGVLGKVSSSTSTQITITDIDGDKRIIEIDELTNFSDPDDDDFGISDIKEGQEIGVIGLLNKAADRILARYVNIVSSIPEYFQGVVYEIDARNFQLHAVDEKGNKRIIDIVPSTKNNSFSKEDGLVKSGFSRIEVGQRVFAAGFMDDDNENQLNATRVIHFIDVSPSEKMKQQAEPLAEDADTTPTPTRRVAPTDEDE